MRRTSIKPKRIHELAVEYLSTRSPARDNPEGGRPRIFEDALILSIASIQNLHQFSYREALEFCEDYFPDIPALSSYHYRLSKIPPRDAQGFIEFLGQKIASKAHQKVRFFIVDGTGFSFHDAYPMSFHRGTEIKKIRAHAKILALVGVFGKKRFAISATAGRP